MRIHVDRGVNAAYVVQGKVRGGRKWREIRREILKSEAFKAGALALAGESWRRVRILYVADYYDPIQVAWMEVP